MVKGVGARWVSGSRGGLSDGVHEEETPPIGRGLLCHEGECLNSRIDNQSALDGHLAAALVDELDVLRGL